MSFSPVYRRADYVCPLAALYSDGPGQHRGGADMDVAIGTFMVVNPDGWIATTAHYLDRMERAQQARQGLRFWGWREVEGLRNVHRNDELDIAVGRLDPFEADWVQVYPRFKAEWGGDVPGRGEPVAAIGTGHKWGGVETLGEWFKDRQNRRFVVPDALPPYNPYVLDGAVTDITRSFVQSTAKVFPRQCGAPLVDVYGTTWGLQRAHLSRTDESDNRQEVESTFSEAVRADAVTALLDEVGAEYRTESWWTTFRQGWRDALAGPCVE